MYDDSPGFRNRNFVVLSKQLVILEMSLGVLNFEFASFPVEITRVYLKDNFKAFGRIITFQKFPSLTAHKNRSL